MGKTALLKRFAQTRCNRPDDPASPLAVAMDMDDLRDEQDIANAILGEARDAHPMPKLLAVLANDLLSRAKLHETRRTMASKVHLERLERPICLLVDEAQTAERANRVALRKLHYGTTGLPILPVYAGLNDSAEALRRVGISGLDDEARIVPQLLDADDARAAGAQAVRGLPGGRGRSRQGAVDRIHRRRQPRLPAASARRPQGRRQGARRQRRDRHPRKAAGPPGRWRRRQEGTTTWIG